MRGFFVWVEVCSWCENHHTSICLRSRTAKGFFQGCQPRRVLPIAHRNGSPPLSVQFMVANRKGANALAASCEDGVAEVGLDGFSFNSLAEALPSSRFTLLLTCPAIRPGGVPPTCLGADRTAAFHVLHSVGF